MLVWVASYPRSGSTLTMLTLHDVFRVQEFGTVFQDDLSLGRLLHQLVPMLGEPPPLTPPSELRDLRGKDLLDALRERPETYFIKTHRLSEASDPAPALYIVRDGRDAIVSQAHYVEMRRTPRFRGLPFHRRMGKLIRQGVPTYGHWSDNVEAWRTREGPVAVLRFEDLVRDPASTMARGCEELSVALPERSGEMLPFGELRDRVPEFFRRGIVGTWRDEMPPNLQKRFWRIHGDQMSELGYT